MQKGVVHLLVPIILVVLAIAGFAALAIINNSENANLLTTSPTNSSPTTSLDTTQNTDQQIAKSPTPTPTSIPTKSPTATQKPTQPQFSKATCGVYSSPDENDTNKVKLTYSLTNNGVNASVASAQWDFDGNGTWDTDMSSQNLSLTHSFADGTYTVKLHLGLSNGETTAICSGTVTVPQGISVSFKGRVFADNNCNNVWDTDEQFIGGITVNIFKQPGNNVYKTLTTDSGGNFSFSTIIGVHDNLTITPGAMGTTTPPYYKIYFNPPSYTLNNSVRSASTTVSIVPGNNISNCPL